MMNQPTTTPTLLRMEAEGGWKEPAPAKRVKKKKRCLHWVPWPLKIVIGLILILFAMDLLLESGAEFDGQPLSVAVIASLGSGSFTMARELRLMGLDVSHEATAGADGFVSWAHALMYLKPPPQEPKPKGRGAHHHRNHTTDGLCREFFPFPTWHVESIAPLERSVCGDAEWAPYLDAADQQALSTCWRDACGDVMKAWRGCGYQAPGRDGAAVDWNDGGYDDQCPIPLAPKPIVLVRHPLRNIESLVAVNCPAAELSGTRPRGGALPPVAAAIARLLPPGALDETALAAMPCAQSVATAHAAYSEALAALVDAGTASLVRRERADAPCAVVERASQPAPPWKANARLERAKRYCHGAAGSGFRLWPAYLRQELDDFLRDGFDNDYENHLNGPEPAKLRGKKPKATPPHVALDWPAIEAWDAGLATDLRRLAAKFGYAD